MDSQEIISRTIGFLQKNVPPLQGIYLFGSRASGDHQDDSDIDIAMLLHPVAAKQIGMNEKNLNDLLLFTDCIFDNINHQKT